MTTFSEYQPFYKEAIDLIDTNNYAGAIKVIKNNLDSISNNNDLSLAFLYCGFLNNKLCDYNSAIQYFSKSISIELNFSNINKRSKDISYNGRGYSRYKIGEFKLAIEDKMKAVNIRLSELDECNKINTDFIDYRNILLGTFMEADLTPKHMLLIKSSQIIKNKYDLIEDFKKVITNTKKQELIYQLELLSKKKYKVGDFKGSIKALIRSEKYY